MPFPAVFVAFVAIAAVSTSVELDEFFRRGQLRRGILQHPQQMLKHNNLTRNHHDIAIVVRRWLINQLLKQRVCYDIQADKIWSSRLTNEDRLKLLGVDVFAIIRTVAHRRGRYRARAPTELRDRGPSLNGWLELGEGSSFDHGWKL